MPQSNRFLRTVMLVLALTIIGVAIACNGGGGGGTVKLQGAGATYPNPLYQKWISEYGKLNPNIRIDYQSIGSGGGQKQIKERTVDFGASDSFVSDQDLKNMPD